MAGFSIITLVRWLFRRKLRAAGLESKTVTLDDGVTSIHLWVPGAGYKAPADAPPLLLLHGFGVSSLEWASIVPALAPHVRLYIPDLLFMGDSTTTAPDRSEIFQADCVAAALKAAGAPAKVHGLGTSYGGMVLYRLAQRHPDALGKLVFSSSGVTLTPTTNAGLLERTGRKDITELLVPRDGDALKGTLAAAFHKGPPLPPFAFAYNDYVKVVTDKNREQKYELLNGMVLGTENAPPVTPLSHESLIIWGDKDQIFDISMASELKELLPEGTKIAVIKETGHVPQEEAPKDYVKELLPFLLGK